MCGLPATPRALVVKVAVLGEPPDNTPVPRVAAPSINVTVPVAPAPAIVAVKVTELPYAAVGDDETTFVAVDALFTVCGIAPEVDVAKFPSPL
jgi:hypothetical protein